MPSRTEPRLLRISSTRWPSDRRQLRLFFNLSPLSRQNLLVCVRWYAAYPLSLRRTEEMMAKPGVVVDHATIHRWSIKMMPVLAEVFRRRKRPVGTSWRMDESYIKISGEWKYLYRAVDRAGHTVDFLLRAHRDLAAARCSFERAIKLHGVPEKITIDKGGANTAAIVGMCTGSSVSIEMRQSKYLNNLIERDHRASKRVAPPMLEFKSFRCARAIIESSKIMNMTKKGQLDLVKDRSSAVSDKFYSSAI